MKGSSVEEPFIVPPGSSSEGSHQTAKALAELIEPGAKRLVPVGFQIPEIPRQSQLVLDLIVRPQRDVDVLPKLGIPPFAAPLGKVRRHRDHRLPDVRDQTIPFPLRPPLSLSKDQDSDLVG